MMQRSIPGNKIDHILIQLNNGHRDYIIPEKCISGFVLIDMRQGNIYTDYNIYFNNQPSLYNKENNSNTHKPTELHTIAPITHTGTL
jgi:hypothetical protein